MKRVAFAGALAFAVAVLVAPAALAAEPTVGTAGEPDEPARTVLSPGDGRARDDRTRGRRQVLRGSEGVALAFAVSGQPDDRGHVRRGDPSLDRQGLVGEGRADRPREGRGRRRSRLRGMDRAAGCVGHGSRACRVVRRQGSQRVVDVDSPQRRLLRRSRRLAAASELAHARPARFDLVRSLALVLQPGRGSPERAARRPPSCLPARSHVLDRVPRASPGSRALLARLAARRGRGLSRRPPRRPQPRDAPRSDRRRVRRCDRGRPDPRRACALREHACPGHGAILRQEGCRRLHPRLGAGQRPL